MKKKFNQVINAGYLINYLLMKIKKVRDHDYITRKYRGSTHWNYNINVELTERVPAVFRNFRGYDRHLIMQEINEFNVEMCYKWYLCYTK